LAILTPLGENVRIGWKVANGRTIAHIRRRGVTLEIRLDRAILLIEEGHVRHQILDDIHVRERVDSRFLVRFGGDTA